MSWYRRIDSRVRSRLAQAMRCMSEVMLHWVKLSALATRVAIDFHHSSVLLGSRRVFLLVGGGSVGGAITVLRLRERERDFLVT